MLTTLMALLTLVTVLFVTVHARPFPCSLPPLPSPTNDLIHPPGQDLQPLQPPFFYPETRSLPPPSMPNVTPPPGQDLTSQQPKFFPPESSPQILPPPFVNQETRSPPPSIGSKFIQKLIIAAVILAVILVLLLVLGKCKGLNPETAIQAVGWIAAVMTWFCA